MWYKTDKFKFILNTVSLILGIAFAIIAFSLTIALPIEMAPGLSLHNALTTGEAASLVIIFTLLAIVSIMTFKMTYKMSLRDYLSYQERALNNGIITQTTQATITAQALENMVSKEIVKQTQKANLDKTEILIKEKIESIKSGALINQGEINE